MTSFYTVLILSFVKLAEMVGGNEWEAAFQKAKLLVGQMTLEEKVRLTQGDAAKSKRPLKLLSNFVSNSLFVRSI
jgi:hypothetical protein